MKHHFGDVLDRSGGHWTVLPNVERYAYQMPEWTSGQKLVSIATISSDDANWELIETFPNLQELTLHSPSHEQLAFVSRLWRLKRLRITHARPKDIGFLARLQNLEEVILEYVSGFSDISPLAELKQLRALHLENLRRVSDFSGLKGAGSLKYLSIHGTFDRPQPVDSFEFLSSLDGLEHLGLHLIKGPKVDQPLSPIRALPNLRKLDVSMHTFPLEVFAWVEANCPRVDGAVRPAFYKSGGNIEEIVERDIRFRMPIEEFDRFEDLFVGSDGKRYERVPHQALLLGRGQRRLTGAQDKIDKACELHAQSYKKLVAEFSDG
ncbi:hypothetical protein [Neorhizobium sp. JUb45]|uniref:hypothetical protein n=1 Tax=unclassified Neorhizobium TaxID=2629175 RepID=UPI0010DD511C|nr:hypothetical protein [Neorhizobium sp. JUb45]TCR04163.1 hypothetical protein EDF70_102261 [Neorhizobium sp. JUb45]